MASNVIRNVVFLHKNANTRLFQLNIVNRISLNCHRQCTSASSAPDENIQSDDEQDLSHLRDISRISPYLRNRMKHVDIPNHIDDITEWYPDAQRKTFRRRVYAECGRRSGEIVEITLVTSYIPGATCILEREFNFK